MYDYAYVKFYIDKSVKKLFVRYLLFILNKHIY